MKKLAKKFTALLLKFKKKDASSVQDAAVNSVIDHVTKDVEQVAEVVDKAIETVVEVAKEEAKKVEEVVAKKVPKPKAPKKPLADKPTSGDSKPKGRPKKA